MSDRYPVILVHGWNSHPGIWKNLGISLEDEKIPYRKFDHTSMKGAALPDIATALGEYLQRVKDGCGWSGPVDIVCHSVGTCIVRYLLEVTDRTTREHPVRQLIGLGPPNNGSALAELFNEPKYAEEIINRLTGVFVPRGFDPAADRIVQDVRPQSPVMHDLRSAGLRHDITYRIIVTANPVETSGFFPWFKGKTWEIGGDGKYRTTLDGDGIVPHRESALPGISLDIIPAAAGREAQYSHINLPRNPQVIGKILHYLTSPGCQKR